jgi:hypothetical protein
MKTPCVMCAHAKSNCANGNMCMCVMANEGCHSNNILKKPMKKFSRLDSNLK